MQELINEVKEFRRKKMAVARDLKRKGAPITAIREIEILASKAVANLEGVICFTNMQKSGEHGDVSNYLDQHMSALRQTLAS